MKGAGVWIWGLLWCVVGVAALSRSVDGFDDLSAKESLLSLLETDDTSPSPANQLMVPLTLIHGAAAKGAVCLDGTPPGYHLHRGSGSVLLLFQANQLNFRGQRIWSAAMEELMAQGMKNAEQALLSGCSAGGLASILHCDEFGDLFPKTTKVKCLSDAGMFLDAIDVGGGRTLRNMFNGVVKLQGVAKNLPNTCTSQMDPTSCFFPQNLVANIKTPMFLLNAAYDVWQIHQSLAPSTADPHGYWKDCKENHAQCNASQIQFLQDFRDQMLNAINVFSKSEQNGLFINSCFAHCQSEKQDTWFANDSPVIAEKAIAVSVGDWFLDRTTVKAVDCAYPCDKSCHDLVFK
ncbi:hypothetical protein SLEP1_g4509 [Rubroshorea leprosula]|uniref:Pectin acetylesterase n=1 Tax=Rubroshorea leprosula TaxID=152421 RepID=A0AAV5HXS1_9ROSI|nr:hypothetical protein SLEP1_g4509 [Rubroshorea leprosula]